ncbi:helix-turn-helix domain-containing protein [Streptacidiphilus sp. EB129]|uniref:helix-turn-helix domain-containing protein n=1 Tax=Streptacidiphilus sp. EB129 TaxID=3156262 RepID=UPI003512F22D
MAPSDPNTPVGARIAAARRARRMEQGELAALACVSLSTIKKIEQGKRNPGEDVLDAIAEALDIDPARLLGSARRSDSRIHAAVPALRAAVDAYDLPDDGPVRDPAALRSSVADLEGWRLASRYTQLARALPEPLAELSRAVQSLTGEERLDAARLLASAYRSADAVAYKYGYHDLSARLIELMRWAACNAEDPVLEATAAYVRMEVFFASRQPVSLSAGLRTLQAAIDRAPAPDAVAARAAVGALHMRAAVAAGRMKDATTAEVHLAEAKALCSSVREGVYLGTAFGPSSYRVHEVAVGVELNDGPAVQAAARQWKPPLELPAERRSHYYIDVARAQLWQNLGDDAFESLRVARRIAPQHCHEHPQVHETMRSLVRTKSSDRESLIGYAKWVGVI